MSTKLLTTLSVLATLLILPTVSHEAQAALKVWTYGNYCGKGKGHGAPIDKVDAACKRHDECCVSKGTIQAGIWGFCNCSCDRTLIKDLNNAISSTKRKKTRAAGKKVLFYIKNTFCHCGKKRTCFPRPSCKTKKVCTKIPGKKKKICARKPVCKTVKSCTKLYQIGTGGRACFTGKKLLNTLKKLKLLKK